MIKQVFVKKKDAFDIVTQSTKAKIKRALHQDLDLTVYYYYEVEGLSDDNLTLFAKEILSEPVTDDVFFTEPVGVETLVYTLLGGQFDQRAYYALQAGKLILDHTDQFQVRSSTVLVFHESVSRNQLQKIKELLINPVDMRERSIKVEEAVTGVTKELHDVSNLKEYTKQELVQLKQDLGLFMDLETLEYIQGYYKENNKNATETELFLFDTYWSDHCRHTTFLTTLEDVKITGRFAREIQDSFDKYLTQRKEMKRVKPLTLMDLATHNARFLKANGKLQNVEDSEEINACSVYTEDEHGKYLLMFKNETHNHPTEIEPFGGAQTCLGGAIRDPLSGRSFVYQGIRVSGAADPTVDFQDTLKNKLPQATISRDSARGFSSYGNQIGLATTMVKEYYHPSYVAKHFECGAVVGISKLEEVRRERPLPSDLIVLLGGRTGKDGIGGASGSSVSHTKESLDTSYAQIQKGNPLEERKLQRLFKNPEVKQMIKRSNDFGAGGVSVAIGELADGLVIHLDRIPLKTTNMNVKEIAISESQERMAVVIQPEHLARLEELAAHENVEATLVAEVTDANKLIMMYENEIVVDIDRDFLDTNGPLPKQNVLINDYIQKSYDHEKYRALNNSSQKGLMELFDCSVGYSTIFSPYGGKTQRTTELGSVQRFPLHDATTKASAVTVGFDPTISEESPYKMGMYSVLSSVAKFIALGGKMNDLHLSFQEYFPRLNQDDKLWGLVLQALLGAFEVSDQLGLAAIGGKDSMSGTYEDIDVIPTLVSFGFGQVEINRLRSRAFPEAGEYIYYLPQIEKNGLPHIANFLDNCEKIERIRESITAISVVETGLKETLKEMALGNDLGFDARIPETASPTGFVFTSKSNYPDLPLLGMTTTKPVDQELNLLSELFPTAKEEVSDLKHANLLSNKRYFKEHVEEPTALIVTFSGTNSELDMEMNFKQAGAKTNVFVIKDTSHEVFLQSVEQFVSNLKQAHIFVLPGGFSFSDEPDGSGKYIAAFLKNEQVKEAIHEFLTEDKLILGICNGFQGLIKSGLLPYGKVQEGTSEAPTLFFNEHFQHVSKLVDTKVASNRSPWLQDVDQELVYTLPVSHSEGRFVATPEMLNTLTELDCIATRYVDNPNGSIDNIEGITSVSGNILGKMAHNERSSNNHFINIPGNKRQDIFQSGVNYFRNGGRK